MINFPVVVSNNMISVSDLLSVIPSCLKIIFILENGVAEIS